MLNKATDSSVALFNQIISSRHKVHIHNGRVYVNDRIVDEIPTEYSGLADTPYTLGEGEYFVLGDNRSNSLDNRYPDVGIIKKDQICGKVIFVK